MLKKVLNHLDPGYHLAQFDELKKMGKTDTPSLEGAYHIIMTQVETVLYSISPVLLAESLGVPPNDAIKTMLVSFPTTVGIMFSYGRRREILSSMKNGMGKGIRTVYQKSRVAKDFLAQKLGFKKETENWVNLFYSEST